MRSTSLAMLFLVISLMGVANAMQGEGSSDGYRSIDLRNRELLQKVLKIAQFAVDRYNAVERHNQEPGSNWTNLRLQTVVKASKRVIVRYESKEYRLELEVLKNNVVKKYEAVVIVAGKNPAVPRKLVSFTEKTRREGGDM